MSLKIHWKVILKVFLWAGFRQGHWLAQVTVTGQLSVSAFSSHAVKDRARSNSLFITSTISGRGRLRPRCLAHLKAIRQPSILCLSHLLHLWDYHTPESPCFHVQKTRFFFVYPLCNRAEVESLSFSFRVVYVKAWPLKKNVISESINDTEMQLFCSVLH